MNKREYIAMTPQCCKSKLIHILFGTETEFAEMFMGIVSIVIGIWLWTPAAHPGFSAYNATHMLPEIWGILLIISGTMKLWGIYDSRLAFRKFSCLLATWVWGFVAYSFYRVGVAGLPHLTGLPLAILMLVFNGLIYIKLEAVLSRRKRSQ